MRAEADLLAVLERQRSELLAEGAVLLRGFAIDTTPTLLADIAGIASAAPFRQMQVPGGHTMSVAMTGAGAASWVSDRSGYRYASKDPLTGHPWPSLPAAMQKLATVSVSLGLPATFLWGGPRRSDRPRRVLLASGDVVVWGGPARLTYHGIAPLAAGEHELTGACRYNLTFRRAL